MIRSLITFLIVFASPTGAEWGTRYTIPHLVTTFLEADNTMAIEISYAIPRAGVKIAGGNQDIVQIEQALTVVDTLGKTHHESWARPTYLPPAGTTAVRRNYVLANEQILLRAGEYDLHLGIRDLKVKSTGSFHVLCREPGADGRLDLSDLLLATDIQTDDLPPTIRHNLVIHPNPLRLYQTGERVFVYLELYNLKRDEFGQTNFEIAYQMEGPRKKNWMQSYSRRWI